MYNEGRVWMCNKKALVIAECGEGSCTEDDIGSFHLQVISSMWEIEQTLPRL